MALKQTDIRVVIGAGKFNNNLGWIVTQEETLNLLERKTWETRFSEGSITALLAEHIWEHLTYEQGVEAARICYQYLKPTGYIRIAVPDGYYPDEAYQKLIQVGGPGPANHPAASHKIVYNYKSLTKLFKEAGFEIQLLEFCDKKGDFYYSEWQKEDGVIFRSKKCDPRNQKEKLTFPSLILDAIKR